MGKYQTKQRKILIAYLEQHADSLLSVAQIAEDLKSEQVSASAIYRNFSELEQEGKVRKVSRKGDRSIYYQYLAATRCQERLHLNCKKCGCSYHLNVQLAETIKQRLARIEKFEMDISETVIYGICDTCSKNK